MPPITLWCLPSQDWFDKRQARPHSRETHNRVRTVTLVKNPRELMRGR